MPRKLCVIPGDGIGPEVVDATVQLLQKLDPDLQLRHAHAGWQTFEEQGDSVPETTLQAIRDCGAALFGAVSSPSHAVAGYQSAVLKMRQQLELFANVRPVDSRWSDHPGPPVKMLIVRENTEDLYVRRERREGDTAVAERVITKSASEKIGQTAASIARLFGFSKITIVHKANVLPISDGLFRDSVLTVCNACSQQGNYPLQIEQALVDIAAYRLLAEPHRFQVIVTTNLFGDILSDIAAHWCGGMGRAPSLNLGNGLAIAEPVHGSAPDIAGRGIADPTATMLSAALLYRLHWNQPDLANAIENQASQQPTTRAL